VKNNATSIDKTLLLTVVGVCLLGLVMVYSSSEAEAYVVYGNASYFFQHQVIWLVIGCVGGLFALGLDYHRLRALAPLLMVGATVLLVLVLVPHIGVSRNGARRWFGFGSFTIQPAELAKLVAICYLARWLEKSGSRVRSMREGLLPFLLMLGLVVGLVLLEKDLNILAEGVVEGRRIFANTIKYVLMGTSSNFGNMFSAAGASLFLPFLPMTPTQILLNNLLYDGSEMTIPTDRVDEEALERPSHWDIHFIRRFMLAFGPISSLFDFATFGLMLWVFHARPGLFQTGWFVESLATQTLVIFVIRTRRVPFFRSGPSRALLIASLAVVAAGIAIPLTPLGPLFGFARLPLVFYPILAAMIGVYLLLVEAAKSWFFRSDRAGHLPRMPWQQHRIGRLLGRWSPAPR